MNQREIAYKILKSTLKDGEYANIAMKNELNQLLPIKRAWVTEIVNGVLRHYEELSTQFLPLVDKLSGRLQILLAMAFYERYFMHEKAYAINNEYPKLVNKKGEKALISAILNKDINYHEYLNEDLQSLSIHYSMPLWIVKLLKKQYDEAEFKLILKESSSIPEVFYRLNKQKCTFQDLEKYEITIINEDSFKAKTNLINTNEFKMGKFYVQDVNSAKLMHYLDLEKGMKFLDVCSAPGGKLFNALDVINPQDAYGNDLHEHRVKLIQKQAHNLGFEGVNYLNLDGCTIKDNIDVSFDRILLDVPCSGLGVMKRKPDLRYHIKPENLDELVKIQAELLENIAPLLKTKGIMVYSTCTLNRKENDTQVANFIAKHPDFKLLEAKTILFEDGGDAFYVAKLQKD